MARRVSRTAALVPALFFFAGALLPAPAAAQAEEADACAAVERAVRAIGEAERFHSKLVARTPGRRRPAEEEQFVIGDVVYASSPAAGRWVKLPMRPADRASLSSSVTAYPPRDCRDEGAADLGGTATRVYAYRQDTPGRDGVANPALGRLWVAVSDGRPRRYEGRQGEVRVVLTLDYDAVEPPFGKQ